MATESPRIVERFVMSGERAPARTVLTETREPVRFILVQAEPEGDFAEGDFAADDFKTTP